MKKRVLICGDGNFSFSMAVAKLQEADDHELLDGLLGMQGPYEFQCTSFDSEEQLLNKYAECAQIFPYLHRVRNSASVTVRHGVNAWELETSYPGEKFDAVMWNHPHLGTENFNLHRFLMCHYLHSALGMLKPGGSVLVSVLKGQAVRWDIVSQARKVGLRLAEARPFLPSQYPGYETRRNRTGGSFQNAHTQGHTGDALLSVSLRFQPASPGAAVVAAGALPAAELLPATPSEKSPAPKPFACRDCGKTFRTKQGVDTHHKQVHVYKKYGDWKATGKGTKCSQCDKLLKDEEAKWQHEIACHTEDITIPHPAKERATDTQHPEKVGYGYFPCDVCGMSVSSHPDWGMEAHLESLKPIVGLELPCGNDGCALVFIEQRALRQHRNFCRVRAAAQRKERRRRACRVGGVAALVLMVAGILLHRARQEGSSA